MIDIKSELQEELSDLSAKINNLGRFLGSINFDKLSVVQQSLLVVQKDAMETYATCLVERIKNL